jgi:Zn-dependent peptidase ImmA (M78 family)
MLQWARDRAGLEVEDLAKKVGTKPERVEGWEQEGELTYKQAEKLAKATHTPFGYLFLLEPPEERLPIPDFRTVGGTEVGRPSRDLMDVIHQCQRRQQWFRDYLLELGAPRLELVGNASTNSPKLQVAASIRRTLAFHPATANGTALDDVLREFVQAIESIGVLVMKSGVVGNSTRRKLDPNEFRGFALVDEYAPLIFVNGSDSKAAQLFTLAHELVHIWIGESALSNLRATFAPNQHIERFCNAVAAEYLVPTTALRGAIDTGPEEPNALVNALRVRFKVSSLVILRRLKDVDHINNAQFQALYQEELDAFEQREQRQTGGGNYYLNQPNKVSRKFATALVASTLEGRTNYRDAFSLLDMKKTQTFKEFARTLDFPVR